MTEQQMKDELQKANDLLVILEQQRNSFANQLAHTQAALLAKDRSLVEAQEKLKAALADTEEAQPEKTKPNGHDENAVALQ